MKILILGAGPCGLGAAYQLNKHGYKDWVVFEKSSHVGGLSSSFVDDKGFTWDIGGHVLFSHYPCFDKAVEEALGDAWYEHQRESWIRILQKWVPYPFQNNIRYLPVDVLAECIDGLKNLQGDPALARNFHKWMESVFGRGIVKYFMEPYNRKVWGTPLEEMSKEWIAERVSVIDLARVERNVAEGLDDLSWGPNSTFRFPKHGGTGAIYEAIADNFREKIHLNHAMTSIDPDSRQVTFSNGKVESYDILINTTPLDMLVKSCINLPERVYDATGDLVHNSGLIVGLGFEAVRNDSKCWMYFPEPDSPFYRVTNFHNYSPYNVPGGETGRFFSLMCETTYSSTKPQDSGAIINATIQGLINSGMIDESEAKKIISRYLIDIPYSYPIPTINRDRALDILQPYLETKGIYSRGRFGAWKYEVANMDHSFMQGVEAVDRILDGSEEYVFQGKG